MLRLVKRARKRAAAGTYNGQYTPANRALIEHCTHRFAHNPEIAASLVYTRDQGMHSSGWWKNPDYERCLHLSLAFVDRQAMRPVRQQHDLARTWCAEFFGDHVRKLWVEPPYTPEGKQRDVYHYRLFMAPGWHTPILPRKEVYTLEFTALGWKSWSDVHPPGHLIHDTQP